MAAQQTEATVRRIWQETPKLRGVVLEVPAACAARYQRPGQVIVVRPPQGEGQVYLALASAPGEARAFELLVGDAAFARLGLLEGQSVVIEGPTGNGFPVDRARGRDVLLFAVGSALAPIRPLVETIRRARSDYGRVTLYVGAHTEQDFPYKEQFPAWAADGIDIHRCVSTPWVQARFREHQPAVENAVAFLCGMKPMMEETREALVEAGLPEAQIASNW